MTKTATTLAIVGVGLAAALAITASRDFGPLSFHGSGRQWTLKDIDTPGMVRLTVARWTPGNRWVNSMDVRLANFRGLSRQMMERGGPAKFEYVQDAGSLLCEGTFNWNGGSGNFRFEPNLRFNSELRGLGYMTPSDDQLFAMTLSGVTLEFARAARDAGLNPSTSQLLELRSHGVTTEFIADAVRAGYRDFTAQDYVELKSHGVNTWFLRDLRNFGYRLSAREIVELSSHGVSSDFLADLKHAGYNLDARQITDLSAHGIGPQYVRELKSYGLEPSADDLVQLRSHGVSADYLKGLKDAGYRDLPVRDIVDLTSHGVSARFIREAKEAGYDFTARELIELCSHGVDGNYLRHLHETGMKNLSAMQIEKLRMHGVD